LTGIPSRGLGSSDNYDIYLSSLRLRAFALDLSLYQVIKWQHLNQCPGFNITGVTIENDKTVGFGH
jgi:hypothetical protein